MKRSAGNVFSYVVMLLWGLGCWLFFQLCYSYHFFYQEQTQLFLWSGEYVSHYFAQRGGLAQLAGDFLTQFYYYLYAGAAILTLCLLAIGVLLRDALLRFGLNRHVALGVAIAVMTLVGAFHFGSSYRLGSTVAVLGWTVALWVVARLPFRWVAAVVLLPLAYWLFGLPQATKLQAPDLVLERDLAVDSEYYFDHYDRVVKMVEEADVRTPEMMFFYHLVQAQRGVLPDHLLRFNPIELGTFYRIGPDTPLLTIRNMNELYWVLGDMTFTERAAMMACVFAPQNRDVRMVKRLAEVNLVSGNKAAADKFLGLLSKTLVYRRWARSAADNPLYRQKASCVPQRDTITTSDNAHFLMVQLLDANPANAVALDYMLCSDLLLKDIASFKRDYDRYCTDAEGGSRQHRARTTKLYQEALCIWLAGSGASEEEWQKCMVRQDIVQRFRLYNEQRGSADFKDTYWYYFDKRKAPEL